MAGARFRGEHANFLYNIRAPEINIRDERGRFTDAQNQLYRQNQNMAVVARGQVARIIDNSILRQKVKSGRLVRATANAKNSAWGFDYVGVGDVTYLDQSIAKYWRTIEEGSAKAWTKRSFLTLELQGIWGLNVGSWNSGPSGDWIGLSGKRESGGKAASPGGRRGAFGRARQEMYQPLRRGRGGGPSPLPVFHPGREIAPMRAYEHVYNQSNFQASALAAAQDFIAQILGTPTQNPRPIRPSGFRGEI